MSLPSPVVKEFQYGKHTVRLETGEIARQADGAVMVHMGDTVVLVTAVVEKSTSEDRDFFPMTVNYQEKTYAAGRIPGGFLRREGRPSENETLTSRLIDRPIRPLFPDGFTNEVQVIATVISLDPDVTPDIPALIGASAVLVLSGAPFKGPISAARVGYKNGEYLLNPSMEELESSDLDLVVSGTENAVLMVESEAKLLSEEVMLGAVIFGHEQQQVVIKAITELANEVGVTPIEWTAPEKDTALAEAVAQACEADLQAAYKIHEKMARYGRIDEIKAALKEKLLAEDGSNESALMGAFDSLKKKIVRGQVLAGEARIDGRDTRTVRPITVRTGVLPRAHGSALFTRGETQALVVATLGTEKDAQIIDALEGSYRDAFMLHYNFPPFSVGETGRTGSPGRREIGHGRLARRGVAGVMPKLEDFPYSIRVVSEITESNGSSSMASVCGSSLAMMDAGVPTAAPVAGIAMGLIKEGNDFAVLSDILGDEDHLGDMDFKVAGTDQGITALQMDIKINGITEEIMQIALDQAKEGRLHILGEMSKAISSSNESVGETAPRFFTVKVKPEKVREIIGKGGSTIRALTEETGCTIEIDDDGNVKIAAVDEESADLAKARIAEITAEPEIGKTYDAVVKKIVDFGAFVAYMPGREGLVHVSQIAEERVEDVNDYLKEGQEIRVKLTDIDKQGRVKLSMTAVED